MGVDVKKEIRKIEIMLKEKKYDVARQFLDTLLDEYPDENEFWRKRAYIHEIDQDYENAVKCISEAIKLQALEPDYFYNRGRYLFKLSKYKDAIEDFTQSIRLCDHYNSEYYKEPSYFMRAESYLRLKLYDKARDDCNHLRDGYSAWTEFLRSKEDILNECGGN